MRPQIFRPLLLVLFLIPNFLFSQTAREIIETMENSARGESLYAEMKITTIRPKWTREMELKSWSKGDQFSLMYMVSPSREKGIVYLKREREIWNWVPSVERSIKLPPSMMMQNWMGTDFTNDDLVRQSSIVNDYDQEILREETIENTICWVIKLTPKPEAPVVWGKIEIWVDQTDYLQLKTLTYDEDEFLVNTMKASNIKTFNGRKVATKMALFPADEDGNKTIMEYITLDFDQVFEESFFSIQNMKRIR